MRPFLCIAALLCPSVALADYAHIEGVIANYDTLRDVVDVEIWLDRPFDPSLGERLSFVGHHRDFPQHGGTQFRLCSCYGREVFDSFQFALTTYDMPPDRSRLLNEQVAMGIPVTMTDAMRDGVMRTVVSTTLAVDSIRFDDFTPADNGRTEFEFAAVVQSTFNGRYAADGVGGTSTVNAPRLITSPEPSSVVLALFGVGVLCWHLRRPRSRLAL